MTIKNCSVPMWSMGLPAGCCDQDAYGKKPKGIIYRLWDGSEYRDDGLYPGYVPDWACSGHGGPKLKDLAHCGDPCKHCGVSHDDVKKGPCEELQRIYHEKRG